MNQLDSLLFIPRFMGSPFYPGGAFVRPQNHNFQGQSMRDLFFQPTGLRGKPLTEAQLECLRQYLIYYIHAPIWSVNDEMIAARKKAWALKADYAAISEFVLEDLLDLGLDPF